MGDEFKIIKCKSCGFKGPMKCTPTFDGTYYCVCPRCDEDNEIPI